MHQTSPPSRRLRAGLAAAVAATALSLAPALTSPAAARTADAAAVECAAAKAALAQAQRQQRVAKTQVVKARKALAKAKKTRRAVKVRKAKAALVRANRSAVGKSQAVAVKYGRLGYACSAPNSAVRASAAGKSLSILAFAQGLTPGPIGREELVALLDRFVPGVAASLSDGQLNAIAGGLAVFTDDSEVGAADALAMLGGAFTPTQITQLLDGEADPALITALVGHIRTQLGGLVGVTPPAGFDPSAALDTLAAILGNLDPTQFGDLLALIVEIANGTAPADTAELGSMLDAITPGLGGVFDEETLTAMLGGLGNGAPAAAVLANLLGGAFTAEQIGYLLDGDISPEDVELAGDVLAHVIVQLGTVGNGALPEVELEPSELVDLFNDVTGQLQGFFCGLPLVSC